MSGNLFAVCVPTQDYEKTIIQGKAAVPPPEIFGPPNKRGPAPIPVPLRPRPRPVGACPEDPVPMEKILEELLKKLEIEHVVWCSDKHKYYYQVFFPVEGGVPTENCIHCLTELGIGKKHNSVVSVLPCSVFFQGFEDDAIEEEEDPAQVKAWNNFVQSIRSKLTVQQVVDGVKSGAECNFDYITLVLTADMVAAMGLVENSEVQVTAAMLISPLMGSCVAVTFGLIIADYKLVRIGLKSEFVGVFMSVIFGYIFGCLCAVTESPWGFGDWPTDEMKGRGYTRSLWIGILYALPAGTGVAIAVLQDSAGPLIGVAVAAQILPPSVNCGLLWGLATITHVYSDVKIPYIKGEEFRGNHSSFEHKYSDWLPNEFAAMGIISFCLALINLACIFATAFFILKVKEVAAPYVATPDLRRFWEYDIRVARDANRHTVQRHGTVKGKQNKEMLRDLKSVPKDELEHTLQAAVMEAVDDDTFRKVKRCSYAPNSRGDILDSLGMGSKGESGASSRSGGGGEVGKSPLQDASTLDQVIQALMIYQKQQQQIMQRTGSKKRMHRLSRGNPLSRSMRHGSTRSMRGRTSARNSFLLPRLNELGGEQADDEEESAGPNSHNINDPGLPTIHEGNDNRKNSRTDRAINVPVVGNLLHSMNEARRSHGVRRNSSERISLTQNPE